MENPQEMPVTAPAEPAARRNASGFGWFALGSLFGAMLLFTSAVLGTRGEVLQVVMNPGANEDARVRTLVREAARDGVNEALSVVNGPQPQGAGAGVAAAANLKVELRAPNVQGNANAEVTLIEFSDFQCPYCLRFHTETLPQIMNDYVKTGKIRYAFKQFPALGPASVVAAQASECAADQNAFWEYYNALYDYRAKAGRVPQTKDELIRIAGSMNRYDMNRFTGCVNQSTFAGRVNDDYEDAQRIGGRGTPTFLINGKLVVGAQPYPVFKAAIEEALKKSG